MTFSQHKTESAAIADALCATLAGMRADIVALAHDVFIVILFN